MTATIAAPAGAHARVPVSRGYRFELVKLLSQWRVRLLLLASWIGPALVVAAISKQSALPADTVFGRWLHATGWAAPLVGLGFSGTWALPLLTSVVAGDVFAAEDPARHVAPSAGGDPLAAPDLRGKGAGQPHGHPVAGRRVGLRQ